MLKQPLLPEKSDSESFTDCGLITQLIWLKGRFGTTEHISSVAKAQYPSGLPLAMPGF